MHPITAQLQGPIATTNKTKNQSLLFLPSCKKTINKAYKSSRSENLHCRPCFMKSCALCTDFLIRTCPFSFLKLLIILHQIIYALKLIWLETVILITLEEQQKNHLQLSSANNKFGLKTFACRAPKLWNDLPLQLLEIESLLKFKTSVNDFFQKM